MTDQQLRVLDIAEATRAILTYLDFRSIDKLLLVLQLDASGRSYLLDRELWKELIELQFHGRLDEELAFLALPKQPRIWNWTDTDAVCPELQEFLRVGDERNHFTKSVSVVQGDIGKIKEIQNKLIDGLAFPTNSYLTNHFVGAAAAIFKRAGKGLSDLMNDPLMVTRRDVGATVATPAFEAGVKRLIHCVGPRITQENCYERLYATYENAMHTALAEELECVAIASISTGAMGIPPREGAKFALRAIQKFVRANHWTGNVAIVCLEEHVLTAFQNAKAETLENFNVMPPFPAGNRF